MAQLKLNAMLQGRLIAMLWHGATVAELADETGLHRLTINEYIEGLRKAEICFVGRWMPDTRGRLSVAEHKLGEGKDAKRTPVPRKQITANFRQRQRDAQLLGLTCASDLITTEHTPAIPPSGSTSSA